MALTDTHDFAAAPPLGGDVADFVTLLKPRVMVLVVFTALAGIVGAPGGLHPALAFISLIAIAAGGGASGALNMWYEAESDARMRRTAGRRVPAGRLQPADALGFGLVLAGFSIGLLGLAANWLAAGLLAFTIAFYAVLYTMVLKRLTAQNIVIGGAAGALPPVVGWAAVTGSVPLEPLILFLMIFLWTPPHFWALALFTQGDYERAGIPMMPNVAGEPSTRRQILAYALVLGPAGLLPWAFGQAGPVYAVAAALLGAEFVRRAFVLVRDSDADGNRAAKRLFGYSILYLFGVFGAYMADIVAQRLAG